MDFSNQSLSQFTFFNNLSSESLQILQESASLVSVEQGQTLIRNGQFESHVFLLTKGSIRLLGVNPFHYELFTVGKALPGDLIGFVGLLRQSPCEAAIARQSSELISFPSEIISSVIKEDKSLQKYLNSILNPCEICSVLSERYKKQNPPPVDAKKQILRDIDLILNSSEQSSRISILSSVVPGFEELIGSAIDPTQQKILEEKSFLPIRFIPLVANLEDIPLDKSPDSEAVKDERLSTPANNLKPWSYNKTFDLVDLGLQEATSSADLQGFKLIKGNGLVQANLATLRMAANAYSTPCPVDVIEKALEGVVDRADSVPLQAIGQLAEAMGFQTQLGSVNLSMLAQLELPVLIRRDGYFCLLSEVRKDVALIADPQKGWKKVPINELSLDESNKIEVVLLKRLADTPKKTFGLSWFAPVLNRFKWPLVQVLCASLFIQLFQLANPLLLQQIIDKVINQSNLSALQVLGAALVTAAFFQGLLTAVRTWLLIDTTDRMDLVLGSQVIDKLLRLPLRFFENRPVGELSQRLGSLQILEVFLQAQQLQLPLICSSQQFIFLSCFCIVHCWQLSH